MAESDAFSDDQNDASIKAMSLNSPEVPFSNRKISNDDENDGVPDLKAPFRSVNSILNLSREEKSRNDSRRVSFPDDDKIISGYGEPRNPWAKAKTTSTEDLIQAYTTSCQHWGVKPITKLLMQLQEVKDFSVRAHSLTLKGEKLDKKVVETLESVFKRVQFVIMDLEATNLDDESAAALFDMIEYYESAVNVLIGFNRNIGTNGWQAAAHMMRKMSCLRLFDAHSVPLTDQAVPFVGRALRLSNTLVTLHLENASLSGRPMLLIFAALRMNVTLRELFLADNRLLSTDALQIANLLKFNFFLQLLDIRNNLIQDAGLSHLCSGIMTQPQNGSCGLQTLVLWNNQISHQSMSKLATALRYTNNLSTLNLGQNVLGDDGASKLKDGLLQNHSLLRLGLVGTKLTCEGAIALAEFLAESPRIIRLDLRNNNIKVGGLMALSLAFKINFSLLRLDIDKPSAKDTLMELVEKQDSLITDVGHYAARNKEAALRKVYLIQQERLRNEEQKSSGLRYMDMTNSGIPIASTQINSSHNSNNNPQFFNQLQNQHQPNHIILPQQPNNQQDNLQSVVSHEQLLHDVDDSPINSPELLPSNSVSYHQVSPVMFSSSEMEKRAAQAKNPPVPPSSATDEVFTPNPTSDNPVAPDASVEHLSDIPDEHVKIPDEHVKIPDEHVKIPDEHVKIPDEHVKIPDEHVKIPDEHVKIPDEHVKAAANTTESDTTLVKGTSQSTVSIPATPIDADQSGNSETMAVEKLVSDILNILSSESNQTENCRDDVIVDRADVSTKMDDVIASSDDVNVTSNVTADGDDVTTKVDDVNSVHDDVIGNNVTPKSVEHLKSNETSYNNVTENVINDVVNDVNNDNSEANHVVNDVNSDNNDTDEPSVTISHYDLSLFPR